MRKPRDYDAELKALNDKAKQLKERKVQQLGELVIATGADTLSIEELTGLLLASVERADATRKENWRKRGAEFFQQGTKSAAHISCTVHRNGDAPCIVPRPPPLRGWKMHP